MTSAQGWVDLASQHLLPVLVVSEALPSGRLCKIQLGSLAAAKPPGRVRRLSDPQGVQSGFCCEQPSVSSALLLFPPPFLKLSCLDEGKGS